MRLHYIYRDFPSIAETELGTEHVYVGGGESGVGGQRASRVKRETTQNRLVVLGVKACVGPGGQPQRWGQPSGGIKRPWFISPAFLLRTHRLISIMRKHQTRPN